MAAAVRYNRYSGMRQKLDAEGSALLLPNNRARVDCMLGLLTAVCAHGKQHPSSARARAESDVLTVVVDFAMDTPSLQFWVKEVEY